MRNKIKNNHDNWLKNKKVIQSQKISKKCPKTQHFQFKNIYIDPRIPKKTKTFLYNGTQHKKNYMEDFNSKNKNIKGGGGPLRPCGRISRHQLHATTLSIK